MRKTLLTIGRKSFESYESCYWLLYLFVAKFIKTPQHPPKHRDFPLLMGIMEGWVFAKHPTKHPTKHPPKHPTKHPP